MRTVGWRHLVGITAVVCAVFPLLFVLAASLNRSGTLAASNSLFTELSGKNYVDLFRGGPPYWRWFTNSMIIGVTTAAGTVLLAACAAYAFSRFRFSGRRAGLLSLLLIQMFPQFLAYVAIFLLMTTLNDVFPAIGLGSRLGLILIYLGGAMGVNTYLIYGFFNTIPTDIDEAAKLDGASHAQIFFTIILRLAAPVLAVVGLLSFVTTINDFVIARVVLPDPTKQTLSVGLYSLVSVQFGKNWGVFTAGTVIAAIPVVLLFQFLQRFIVGGLIGGAVRV
jgi:arabinogalactan oligomer/maltooligosaccharide transport system permease protein